MANTVAVPRSPNDLLLLVPLVWFRPTDAETGLRTMFLPRKLAAPLLRLVALLCPRPSSRKDREQSFLGAPRAVHRLHVRRWPLQCSLLCRAPTVSCPGCSAGICIMAAVLCGDSCTFAHTLSKLHRDADIAQVGTAFEVDADRGLQFGRRQHALVPAHLSCSQLVLGCASGGRGGGEGRGRGAFKHR